MKTELLLMRFLFLATVLLISGVMIAMLAPPPARMLANTATAVVTTTAPMRCRI